MRLKTSVLKWPTWPPCRRETPFCQRGEKNRSPPPPFFAMEEDAKELTISAHSQKEEEEPALKGLGPKYLLDPSIPST